MMNNMQKTQKIKLTSAGQYPEYTHPDIDFEERQVMGEDTRSSNAVAPVPLRKILKPSNADVLCGRGGGINNHYGNVAFREMVQKQKEHYSFANKRKKVETAQAILDSIRDAGGLFLQREVPKSGIAGIKGVWVEVDNERAMAKTSQALREGAPSIRAKANKKPPGTRKTKPKARKAGKSSRKRSRSATMDLDEIETKPRPNIIIRGYADGHRGKQLIPIRQRSDLEEDLKNSSPTAQQQHPTTFLNFREKESECPTPPPFTASDSAPKESECPTPPPFTASDTTPNLLPMTPLDEPTKFALTVTPHYDPSSVASPRADNGIDNLEMIHTPSIVKSGTASIASQKLTVMDPTEFGDSVKPVSQCLRLPSLTFSEWGLSSDGLDEPFRNPFESDENDLSNGVQNIALDIDSSSGTSKSVTRINSILRSNSRSISDIVVPASDHKVSAENGGESNDQSRKSSR